MTFFELARGSWFTKLRTKKITQGDDSVLNDVWGKKKEKSLINGHEKAASNNVQRLTKRRTTQVR